MAMVIEVAKWLIANWVELVAQLMAVLVALIGFFMLVPGPQPEKFLMQILEFLKKFSRK